jgi:Ca-activated chloride channel family protein
MSDEEMRSIWLRQVTTKPADFLRAKFAYQQATRPAQTGESQ